MELPGDALGASPPRTAVLPCWKIAPPTLHCFKCTHSKDNSHILRARFEHRGVSMNIHHICHECSARFSGLQCVVAAGDI
eukprot:224299-Amphidinium_carterae.1